MVRKLLFYNVYITCNGVKTNNSICEFLDNVQTLASNVRIKRLETGDYSLLDMKIPNRDENYIDDFVNRYISFGDYRDRKPRLGEKGTDTVEDIDRDVIELTTIGFFNTYKLLAIEYNHYGARINQLRQYLDRFLPKNRDGEIWAVEILPVKTSDSMEKIRRTNNIKNIELTVNVASPNAMNVINQMNQPELTVIQRLFRATVETNEMGVKTGKIFLGKGRGNDYLNTASFILLLETIDFTDDIYTSIKVEYANPDNNRFEKVELKNEGIVSCEIMANDGNDGFEHIADNIRNYFYDNGRPCANNHRIYLNEIETRILPEL